MPAKKKKSAPKKRPPNKVVYRLGKTGKIKLDDLRRAIDEVIEARKTARTRK